MMSHLFAGNPLDLGDVQRRDQKWLDEQVKNPCSRFLPLWQLNVLIARLAEPCRYRAPRDRRAADAKKAFVLPIRPLPGIDIRPFLTRARGMWGEATQARHNPAAGISRINDVINAEIACGVYRLGISVCNGFC
jgi:hypothetical protein